MPSKIRVLTDHTINKIAAGEVIENPSSVVKELVENALDAGATQICVEIQAGGRQLIRISDNGIGMSPDDALLCLERHATSKISEVEDIQEIATMGFRGEAIPSIASISKFTILTCPRKEAIFVISEETAERKESSNEMGTLVMVDGGKILSTAPAARSPGTTIEVKSLFFNVPVRRKFQKSPAYDAQEILKVMSTLALGYPSIQFELISDHRALLKTPAIQSNQSFHEVLKRRIEAILGKEYASQLSPLDFSMTPFEVKGFVGQPAHHKSNRTGQYLFINQRAVYSSLVSTAVREGFGTMLPTNRYPVFVLHLKLPGSLVDVNVHPQKKEVRIRQEQVLKESLMQAVQSSLRRQIAAPELSIVPSPFSQTYASLLVPTPPFPTQVPHRGEEWLYKSNQPVLASNTSVESASFTPSRESPPPPVEPKMATPPLISPSSLTTPLVTRPAVTCTPPPPNLFSKAKLSARVSATLLNYVVIDPESLQHAAFTPLTQGKEGGLCLLDQRNGCSRIYYEKLLKEATGQEASHPLLIPVTLHFSAIEAALLARQLPLLNQMGFSMREFGEHSFLVDALPEMIKSEELKNCLTTIVEELIEQQQTRHLKVKREEQLALAAARASLPKMKRLDLVEAQALVNQLLECELPWQCPIGKATFVYLMPEVIAQHFRG